MKLDDGVHNKATRRELAHYTLQAAIGVKGQFEEVKTVWLGKTSCSRIYLALRFAL